MSDSKGFLDQADEAAVIEQAGFDPYRAFAAQALLLARNFVREQTAMQKPLPDWSVHDIVTALRRTQTRSPTHTPARPTRQHH
jgi:hypothetical protein